jgi:hypothetical protein
MFNPNQAFLLVEKLKSAPRVLHWELKLNQKKIFCICPKLLINAELYGLVVAPSPEKGYKSNLRGQFATLGANVSAFIHILTSMV